MHGAVVWDLARRAYLQGGDPRLICERYGLNRSTFRDRARREGWRREDILEDARPWTRMDENTMELRRSDLIVTAWTHVARAVARNKRLEARSWLAVIRDLGASPALLDRCMEPVDPALPAHPAPAPGADGGSAVSSSPNESAAWTPLTAHSAVSASETRAPVRSAPGPLDGSPFSPPEIASQGAPAADPPPAAETAPSPAGPAPEPDRVQAALQPDGAAPPDPELDPDAPKPWAALLARPDGDTTGAERAARALARPIYRLWDTDRAEARRRWTALVERLGIDPERPLTPKPTLRPALTGFRAVFR